METSSTHPEIEIVYEEPLEMLDESKHYHSVDLVKEINRNRKEINRLKSK